MEIKHAAVRTEPSFSAQAFLDSAHTDNSLSKYRRGETIFTQGDLCDDVLYIRSGGVRLSVVSKARREAIVATLGPGDFLGEGCLAGQTVRMNTALAITPSTVEHVAIAKMVRQLHTQHAMSDCFMGHVLSRYVRIEEDLINQFFDSQEKRLARALLQGQKVGEFQSPGNSRKVSQKALPTMVSMPRSHVNTFLNKFKRLGFINYSGNGPLTIDNSLLNVVLHD